MGILHDDKVYGVIYKVENTINNKVYIGQTTRCFEDRYVANGKDIKRLYNYHNNNKKRDQYYNKHLLSAIEKYGINSFKVDKELDVAYSQEELDEKEIYWIRYHNSFNNGYNRTPGGCGSGKNNLKARNTKLKTLGKKRIVCETEGIVFENYLECIDYFYNVYGFKMKPDRLFFSCENDVFYNPRKITTNISLKFRYAYDYILSKLYNENNKRILTKFAVICTNDNKVFLKKEECKRYYGISNLECIIKIRKDYNKLNHNKRNIMKYSNYIDTVDFSTVVDLFYKTNKIST